MLPIRDAKNAITAKRIASQTIMSCGGRAVGERTADERKDRKR